MGKTKIPPNFRSSYVFFLIFAVSSILYANSLHNSFHFDDQHYIVENPFIRDLHNIPNFFESPQYSSFEKTFTAHYRPLVVSSYALNYAVGRLNPAGYHLVNLLFHVGSAFLVFLIVRELLRESVEKKGSTGSRVYGLTALTAALIFAAHPFNSEIINYITARSSVMSSFFYLSAFLFWMKYRQSYAGKAFRPFYVASLFFFLLAILSKEIAVTLPLVLWLYDVYFLKTGEDSENKTKPGTNLFLRARTSLEYMPFVFLVVIPYLLARKFFFGSMMFHGSIGDVWQNLIIQAGVLTQYLQLLFFPWGLTIEHDATIRHGLPNAGVIFSLLLIGSVLFSAYFLSRKGGGWKIASFFILWFFITILPTTIIPLNAILQENRGYLPGVGFSFFAAFVLTLGRRNRGLSVFFVGLLVFIYALVTFQRNLVWKDDISLWEDAVSKAPGSARAHDNLGLAYFNEQHYPAAETEFRKAIRENSQYFYAHYNLGVLYQIQGRWDEAIDHYQKAVKVSPGFFRAYYNLGLAFKGKGDVENAIQSYRKAIAIDSRYSFVYNNLGVVYYQNKRYPEAIQAYREAIDRDPVYAKAYYNLGNVYVALGEDQKAMIAFQEALKIQPEFENARRSLDRILQAQDHY